jgi:RND superfamily putative drug exporter
MTTESRHFCISFSALGRVIARHWGAVIVGWLVLMGLVIGLAPRWDEVTYDGDLAYMPATMTSVRAERLLERAFPTGRSKSEMVVMAERPVGSLTADDQKAVDRLAARLHNLLGIARYEEAQRGWAEAARLRKAGQQEAAEAAFVRADQNQHGALSAWEEARRLDERFAEPINNRAFLERELGQDQSADQLAQLARDHAPQWTSWGTQLQPADERPLPLIDVWTRHTDIVGSKLRSRDRQAELVVLRMSQEFMATDNIRVLQRLEQEVAAVRGASGFPAGLATHVTGSAAVGGDMLRSAAESIKNTELYTVLMVLAILIVVYRSPLLVAIPLLTIIVSVAVATGLVAALTQLDRWFGWDWWNFRIFTTTKIFVVVILFGSGTDFCLFLIARYKEELDKGLDRTAAVGRALEGVGDALVASAMTTIVGLATMFFAEFGKFRNSGPAIGLCLLVTLLACLTLAPALLCAFGRAIFWPFGAREENREQNSLAADGSPLATSARHETMPATRFWDPLARAIVAHPGLVLVLSVLVLAPWALQGTRVDVTYDFLSELAPDRPTKVGAQAMRDHFPVGETGPLVVLVHTKGGDLDSAEGKAAVHALTRDLYVPGVQAVRSLAEPKGDAPRGFSIKKAALQTHELTRSLYLSKRPELNGDVARLEVLLKDEPFSWEAMGVLNEIRDVTDGLAADPASYWHKADFLLAGTTSAIHDLREVTRRDHVKIQILVTLAVLAVLLVLLRRPVVCIYLMMSVLFSYYVTLGVSEAFFQYLYGATFEGLDWKVPLFLFVILVAVGQDYNIYLATRVFEEQATHGLFGGLRRAIIRTGGIITSCGVIMAGTFVSMATGSLRGVVELGVALSFGVMLDTFVVRPILVPAFLALLFRSHAATPRIGAWMTPQPISSSSSPIKP